MDEYKITAKEKSNFDTEKDSDLDQAKEFWNQFWILNNYWNEQNFKQMNAVLQVMVNIINDEKRPLYIEDDMVQKTNIIHFCFFVINEITKNITSDHIFSYSCFLNSFIQLLSSLFDISQLASELLINEHPISALWDLILFRVQDLSFNSMNLIHKIVTSGQAESEIDFLFPQIIFLLRTEKEREPKYATSLLPIVLSYCEKTPSSKLKQYVSNLLIVINELFSSNDYFEKDLSLVYSFCLDIVIELQKKKFDIFILNHDLFIKIFNIINDHVHIEFYGKVFRFIDISMNSISDDNQKNMKTKEVLSRIDRIINIFQACILKSINIIYLLSNLLLDENSILKYLLLDESIKAIIKYHKNHNYQMRESIIWLVWNMLYVCTSEQLIKMFSNNEIFQIVVDSLDQDNSSFLSLVVKTLGEMINKLGYTRPGSIKYVDIIIDKMFSIIDTADYETQAIFFSEIPKGDDNVD